MVDAFNCECELVRKIQKTSPLNGPKKLFNLRSYRGSSAFKRILNVKKS